MAIQNFLDFRYTLRKHDMDEDFVFDIMFSKFKDGHKSKYAVQNEKYFQQTFKIFSNILANLYRCLKSDVKTIVQLKATYYATLKKIGQYDWVSYRRFIDVITFLEEEGWISVDKTVASLANKRSSEIVATEKLILLFDTAEKYRVITNKELIQVKQDNQAKVTHYCDSLVKKSQNLHVQQLATTYNERQAIRKMKEINYFASKYAYTLPLTAQQSSDWQQSYTNDSYSFDSFIFHMYQPATPTIRQENIVYQRIFNKTNYLGGRYYANIQTIPSVYRKYIRINDEAIAEFDFSSMHISIYAGLHGYNTKQNFYDYPYFDRTITKQAVNVALNCVSRSEAIKTMNSYYPCHYDETKFDRFYDSMEQKVGKDFYGWGMFLQYIESCIAEQVLLTLGRADIPCVCMHDGFFTTVSNAEFLRQTMETSYINILNFKPTIKKEN